MWIYTVGILFDRIKTLILDPEIHGDGSRFDGDASLLFIISCICIASFTGLGTGNDTGFGDERVSKCGLSVVDWDGVLV